MGQPVKTTGKDGIQIWRLNDNVHRDDGPAYIGSSGYQAWYQHGQKHRIDGPAWIGADGVQVWYQHDKLHRDDGPAWVDINGYQEYWLNGTELTEGSLAMTLIKERERRRSKP